MTARKAGTATKREVMDLLAGVPLFTGCSKRDLNLIAGTAEQLEFSAGETICSEGEEGLGLHTIVSGEVSVSVKGRFRRKLAAGAFFGEIAMIDGGPRSATVVAESDCHLLHVPAWGFNSLLKHHPGLALKMLHEVTARLRENDSATP